MSRINGWKAPFHILQVATWIVFPLLLASFFVFYVPLMSLSAIVLGGGAYGVIAGIIVYSVIQCTGRNPADDCILRHSTDNSTPPQLAPRDDQIFCNVCVEFVHKQSRHCRLCDKCVAVFDHHCKWLNNCVGEKNYTPFFTSIVATTVLLSIQIGFGIYLLSLCYTDPEKIQSKLTNTFGCESDTRQMENLCVTQNGYRVSLKAVKVIHIGMLSFLGPVWFLIAQLLFFHVQLCIEGITTYDYILRQRKKQLARSRDDTVRTCWEIFIDVLLCRSCCDLSKHKKDKENRRVFKFSLRKRRRRRNHHQEQEEEEEVDDDDEEEVYDDAALEEAVDDEMEVRSVRSVRSEPSSRSWEDNSSLIYQSGYENGNDSTTTRSTIDTTILKNRNGHVPTRGFGRHLSLDTEKDMNNIQSPSGAYGDYEAARTPSTSSLTLRIGNKSHQEESAKRSPEISSSTHNGERFHIDLNSSIANYGTPCFSSTGDDEEKEEKDCSTSTRASNIV